MSHETVIDDHRLLADFCQSGSEHAFSEIVHRYHPLVVSICRRVLGDLHHAEDAAQATFIALARKAPTLRIDRTLAGWLYVAALASARELRRALLRRHRHEQAAGRELRGAGQHAHGAADGSTATTLALDDLLASLPAEQREALILRYVQGHSEAEAAALLDCPVRTLHNRVARGLARLRERLRLVEGGEAALALPALLAGLGQAPAALASLPAAAALQQVGRLARPVLRHRPGTAAGGAKAAGWTLAGVAAIALPLAGYALLGPPAIVPAPAPVPVAATAPPAASAPAALPAPVPPILPAPALPQPLLAATTLSQFSACQADHWSMTGLVLGGGGTIWTCGYDRQLESWDMNSRQCTLQLAIPGDGMRALALAPDQRTVALALANQVVVLHELGSGAERTLAGHQADVTAVAYSPDGATLVSGSKDGSGMLWDVASGTLRARLGRQHDHVWGVACAPDNLSVVLVGDDRSFWSYDARSGEPRTCFSGYKGVLRSVAYAPDGACLASAGDQGVRLWDARSGACLATLDDHQDLIDVVAFSSDGRWLAAGSLEGRIVIWDAATREVLARGQTQPGGANCLVFSPDRRQLISAGEAPLRIWQLGSDHP